MVSKEEEKEKLLKGIICERGDEIFTRDGKFRLKEFQNWV
jgi:hypothetical protein